MSFCAGNDSFGFNSERDKMEIEGEKKEEK